MKNLIRLILKYYFLVLFVIIESFCLFLLVQNNYYHKAKIVGGLRTASGYYFQYFQEFKDYFQLRSINKQLVEENIRLLNASKKSYIADNHDIFSVDDSIYRQKYAYRYARVVNNSVNSQMNYITIDKGSRDGIQPEMAVISSTGVVGVVEHVSENFSLVISVLNKELKVSGKLLRNNSFGSLSWDGISVNHAILNEIPQHVKVEIGDTVVTSGYSAIFPQGVRIGYVDKIGREGGSFYQLKVKLSTDFKNIGYVYVVNNLFKEEQQNLENKIKNDQTSSE